jgi:hypothetical protein
VVALVAGAVVLGAAVGAGQNAGAAQQAGSAHAANTNLIRNGDFRSLEGWLTIGQGVNLYHSEDPGRADFKAEDGTLRIAIRNEGISIWSVMVYQKVELEKGATYEAGFRARSDAERSIVWNVTQDVTWKNFSGDKVFKLTKTMATYSYEFTMDEGGPALFQFCLGKAGTGTIYLGDVALRKRR